MDGIRSLPGTYALILYGRVTRKVDVGKLGFLNLIPGYYIYVGSAFGPGGLRARINRHVGVSKKKHWHLDYIKMFTQPLEIWYSYDPMIREHQWAETIERGGNTRVLMKGFGSSDCSCAAHLFFMNRKPSPRGFINKIHRKDSAHDRIFVLKL